MARVLSSGSGGSVQRLTQSAPQPVVVQQAYTPVPVARNVVSTPRYSTPVSNRPSAQSVIQSLTRPQLIAQPRVINATPAQVTAAGRVASLIAQAQPMYRQAQPHNSYPAGPAYTMPYYGPQSQTPGGVQSMVPGTPSPIPIPNLAGIDNTRGPAQFYGNAPSGRDQLIAQVQTAYPQMTPNELHGRTTDQLRTMMQLHDQQQSSAVLGGNKTGQPQVPYAPYGYGGTRTGFVPNNGQPFEHTTQDVLPDGGGGVWDTVTGALNTASDTGMAALNVAGNAISDTVSGAAQPVVDAGQYAWNQGVSLGQAAGTVASQSIGGALSGITGNRVVDTAKDLLNNPATQMVVAPAAALMATAREIGKSDELASFFQTPVGQQVGRVLNGLNKPYEWNTERSGQAFYDAATGGMPDSPVEFVLNPVDMTVALALYEIFPELKDGVIDAYENGYSSPTYISDQKKAGNTDYAPQFAPGPEAVHEYLIGRTDDWPPALRDAFRLGENIVMDPLTLAPIVGEAGKAFETVGRTIATADDAGVITKGVGRVIQGTGQAVSIASVAPDALVEVPLRAGGWGWRRFGGGGVPSAFQLTPEEQAASATADTVHHAANINAALNEQPGGMTGPATVGPQDFHRNPFTDNEPWVTPPPSSDAAPHAGAPTVPGSAAPGPTSTVPAGSTGTGGRTVVGFTTSQGSTYEVTPSGTTIRTKTPHAGHDPNDVGLKPESNQTIYYKDPTDATFARITLRQDPDWFKTPQGQAWLQDHVSATPQVGWHPYETWSDGTRHMGNAIVSINYADGTTSATPPTSTVPTPPSSTIANGSNAPGPSSTVPEPPSSTVPKGPTSTIEAEADVIDGLAPTPRVGRPAPDAGVTTDGTTDTPIPGNTAAHVVDDSEPVTVQRHETPPQSLIDETGTTAPSARPVEAAAIPEEFPAVIRAVERYNTTIDTTGKVGDQTYFTPIYGGSRLPDAAVTQAVASGDLGAIARANELVQVSEPLAAASLRESPGNWWLPWEQGGKQVSGSQVLREMTPQQRATLGAMVSRNGSVLSPELRAATMTKNLLEKVAELEVMVNTYAPLMREITGINPVNTATEQLFGFTWTGQMPDGSLVKGPAHRAEYSMERYVTTSSDDFAKAIRKWLKGNTGPDLLNTTNGFKPYFQGIPEPFRDEVLRRLDNARTNYRGLVNASDEDFASGAWKTNPGIIPTSAAQLSGGLKASSKATAKQAEQWIEAAKPKRKPAGAVPSDEEVIIKKPRGVVGFAEMAAEGSIFDRLTGSIVTMQNAIENAKRIADDTAVPNVKNPLLEDLNVSGAPGFGREATEWLNKTIDWKPPVGRNAQAAWNPSEWTAFDALLWGQNEAIRDATFNLADFYEEIGRIHEGLPPKLSPAEKKAQIKLYRDRGEQPPKYLKTSNLEHAQATKAGRFYGGLLSHIRNSSLYGLISGPAGYIGDVMGNSFAAMVNGHFGAAAESLSPTAQGASAGAIAKARKAVESVNPHEVGLAAESYQKFTARAMQTEDALMDPWLRETGQTLDARLYPTEFRETQMAGKPWLNEKVKDRNAVIRGMAELWTPSVWKDARLGGDFLSRRSVAKRVARKQAQGDGILAFKRRIAENLGQANVDTVMKDILAVAESNAKGAGVKWHGYFSPEDVGKATERFGTKQSEALKRAWQSELNLAHKMGFEEQKRIYFSYKRTNADVAVGQVLMFHYWQTRASYMHLRAALRHPVLLNGYYKLWTELKERNEEGGAGYLGPVYRFLTSPSGIYAAFDPLGLLIPTTLLDMQDQEGNKFRVLQNQLTPLFGALGALTGVTDNVPNLLGLRTTERWLINMGNFLAAEGVDVASMPLLGKVWDNNTMRLNMPIDDAVKSILDDMNGWLRDKGIPVADFTPFDRGPNEKDQLNSWLLYELEQDFGPMEAWDQGGIDPETGQWVDGPAYQALDAGMDALTTGAPNKYADAAEQQYATEGAISAALAPLVPGGVITRSGYRDEQIAGNRAGDQAASDNRDVATSADPPWTAMHQQWNGIGTPEQQYVFDTYYGILLHPEDMRQPIITNTAGGQVVIPSSYVAAMDDTQRQDFANRWLAQNPGYEDALLYVQSQRDAFRNANPQMDQFKQYQKAVFNEDTGGVRGFRESLVKTNPNFKAELEDYRSYLEGQGLTKEQIEQRLDSWTASPNGFKAAMGLPIKNGDEPLPVYDPTQNPYANPAMAGMAPQAGGGSGGGESSKITKNAQGQLVNENGELVNEQGKRVNEQGQLIDDYWYPDAVAQRYADQQARYDDANRQMEQQFGPYWNDQTGKWEENANTSSERKKLGIGDIPYSLPEKGDLIRQYEAWSAANGGGSIEDWFTYLMGAPGYGVQADPYSTIGYGEPADGSSPGRTLNGGGSSSLNIQSGPPMSPGAQAASSGALANTPLGRVLRGGKAPSTTPSGYKATGTGATSIEGHPVLQGYGMTPFAQQESYAGGMYGYTNQYTTDGSYIGHMGIDVGMPVGTPLYAPVSGTVIQAGGMPYEQDYRYGSTPGTGGLRIQLPNGDIVVMAHMQEIDVQVGDTVTIGQPVGYSGTSTPDSRDNGSGPHVHVEYRKYAPGQTPSGYLGVNPLTMLDMNQVQ